MPTAKFIAIRVFLCYDKAIDFNRKEGEFLSDQTIRTLIVDDEKEAMDATISALSNFSQIEIAAAVNNSADVIAALKEKKIDAAFLDIEMPDNSGFEMAQYINKNFPSVLIVFVTGHAGFALDCYDFEPVDFLVKPINILRMERAIGRLEKKLAGKAGAGSAVKQTKIGIHFEGGYQIISIDSIKYIEKKGRKIFLETAQDETLLSKYSLGQLEAMLTEHGFFRCHQSFIIPVANIISVQNNVFGKSYSIELKGVSEKIPLSRNKYTELKELLANKGILFC